MRTVKLNRSVFELIQEISSKGTKTLHLVEKVYSSFNGLLWNDFVRFTYLCLIHLQNVLICVLVLTWHLCMNKVALPAHDYHTSYLPYFIFDICFLKSFHEKFNFYQTKGILHEKQMHNVPFFIFLIFFLIWTQKSSCSYWLCECEAYPNCAWKI